MVDSIAVSREPQLPPDDIDLTRVVGSVVARWRLIAAAGFLGGVLGYAASFVLPVRYTATTTFVPEAPGAGMSSRLASLAGQFGVSVGAEGSYSPRFYAEVATSRVIVDGILTTRYPGTAGAADATLLEVLALGGVDGADSLDRGRRELSRRMSTRVDNQTNIVHLSIELADPTTAAAVGNDVVARLNEFNAKTRQSQAHERREFVEARVNEAETDLRRLEDDLRTFYERNRTWESAPQLRLDEERLRRQLLIRQEVVTRLREEFETARIEEVNDTPVITVIDPAAAPRRRSSPRRLFVAAVGAIVATAAIAGYVLVRPQAGDRSP